MISANAEPFESYGLKNSLTSPISRDAGERFAKALNYLLADEKARLFIGPSAYVFWTRKPSGFDFASFLSRPEAEDVKLLLRSPVSGVERSGVDGEDFYALALSASGGRAVVRDWLETTVPDAQENLKRWFRAQRVVDYRGKPGGPLGLFPLAAGAYRDASKEMTPQVPAALVRAAIKGGRVPEDLLARAVRRNRVEGDVSRQRAALMKLVLIYGGETMAETLEELNPRVEDPAYHCGRLLAQLEELQKRAIPGVKATIVDRYYGAASSTPASVFGDADAQPQRSHRQGPQRTSGRRGGDTGPDRGDHGEYRPGFPDHADDAPAGRVRTGFLPPARPQPRRSPSRQRSP